jgi:hypothetical protein
VDYGRDVLFDLITRDSGAKMAADFDRECLPRVAAVRQRLEALATSAEPSARPVFTDLRDRARAYELWTTSLRNVCAWVADVHGYLATDDAAARAGHVAQLQKTIDLEMANTRALLDLWETSSTEFIVVSGVAENGFVYGENLGELLRRKLELMERYRHHPPYIDRDILWRIEGLAEWAEGKPKRPAPVG